MKSVSKTTCFCPWHGGEDTTLTEIDVAHDDDGDIVGAWKQFGDKRCRITDRIATLDRDLNVIGR